MTSLPCSIELIPLRFTLSSLVAHKNESIKELALRNVFYKDLHFCTAAFTSSSMTNNVILHNDNTIDNRMACLIEFVFSVRHALDLHTQIFVLVFKRPKQATIVPVCGINFPVHVQNQLPIRLFKT